MALITKTKILVFVKGSGFITSRLWYDSNLGTYFWDKEISLMPTGFSSEDQAITEAMEMGYTPFSELHENLQSYSLST